MKLTRLHLLFSSLLSSVLLLGAGCSNDGYVPISGKITVDGEPVPNGAITFVPVDGASAVTGAQIRDGSYEARVPPGEKIVQIGGTRMVQQEIVDGLSGQKIQTEQPVRMTPQLYETPNSPLRAPVTDEGGTFDFDVPKTPPKSKKKS